MPRKVPVTIIGHKSQGKSKGAPLYRANGSSTPQRGLAEREIEKFRSGIQLIITRQQENKR